MWLIAERLDSITLEFWPQLEAGRFASEPSVVLGATSGPNAIGYEQWSLIKKQFENMGIVPRAAGD